MTDAVLNVIGGVILFAWLTHPLWLIAIAEERAERWKKTMVAHYTIKRRADDGRFKPFDGPSK